MRSPRPVVAFIVALRAPSADAAAFVFPGQDLFGLAHEKFGVCDVLVKPLEGSRIAVCVFNKGNKEATTRIDFKELSNLGYVNLPEKEYYKAYDVWDERHYDDVACVFATTKGHGVKVYIVE